MTIALSTMDGARSGLWTRGYGSTRTNAASTPSIGGPVSV